MPKPKSKAASLVKAKNPTPKKIAAKTQKIPQGPKEIKASLRDRVLGFIFLLLALVVLLLPQPIKPKEQEKNPISIDQKLMESKKSDNVPTRVLLPKADIDLKVTPSRVIGGYWETSEDTASYGIGSGLPDTKSNTVVFAHAREDLFYNLKDVKTGETIYIFTKDKWYRYKIDKITAVFPDQKEVIMPTKDEVLTLYTCTGFNDEKRLVVRAVREKI